MTNTTHYNMTIAEGTDIVNPLTQIFPNFGIIDDAMFANKQSGIGTATEVTTGSVHAIVRANPDSNIFRFTATSAWTSGDTMTLDGNAVVVHMSDGTVPATGAYIIGAEVLAMVNAGLVTLAISSNGGVTSFNSRTGNVTPEASDYSADMVDFDNANTTLASTDVQGAIEELSAAVDTESTITPINLTAVNGTIQAGGAKRKGDLIVVNVRYTATAPSQAGDFIISFPYTVTSSTSHVQLSNNKNYGIDLLSNGIRSNNAIAAGDTIIMSGVVFIES